MNETLSLHTSQGKRMYVRNLFSLTQPTISELTILRETTGSSIIGDAIAVIRYTFFTLSPRLRFCIIVALRLR